MNRVVRPYGDTTGDGMVQLSFTLPVPHGPRARGAAQLLATKMGIDPAMVVHSHPIGTDFTFVVVYGSCRHTVDLDDVHVVEREYPLLSPAEVNAAIRRSLRRKLVARTRRRGAGLPGGDSARCAPAEHPRDGTAFPQGHGAAVPTAGRGRSPVRPADGRRAGGRPGVRSWHHPPARWPVTWSTPSPPAGWPRERS